MAVGLGQTVGRQAELERLEGALDALDEGALTCLAVEGEPGIGKTRLLAELRERSEGRGQLVLGGSAAEFERDMPFGVWVDALDAYVASRDPERHGDDWNAELLDELAGVLPSLRGGGRSPDSALADERYRAHRAMRSLLELLAQPAPLVLVLDDLHWSDGASIELIAALLRRGPEAPVLLALAFRPGQAPERLTAALAVPHVARIGLTQLSEAQAAELLGDDVDPRSVADIYRHGGGNPFYLEQLARASGDGRLPALRGHGAGGSGSVTAPDHGATSGAPGAGGGADGSPVQGAPSNGAGVPAAVAASLAEELESLSLPARALLDAAAVAGEPFEPDLAAATAELSAADGLAALDDLLAADLVRPTRVPRRFVFRHPLIRRAVYESTGGGWRLAAHERAAAALAARGAAAAERAHHVEQSAGQGDEQAIELLIAAGEETRSRAPGAAARWFEAALRLLPAADAERQAELRVSLASALRSLGELERCRATLLEAIELLPPESAARRVELTALCAAVEHWQGHHEDAHRRLARAWDEIDDRDTAEAAALQIELAVDGLYELDFNQTLAMGRGALETARELGDRALVASAAAALALGEAAAGEIDPAREHRAEALGLIEQLTDAELAPRLEALYYLGWAENYLEHYDEAVAHVDRGIAIARATGEGRLLLPMMLVKGYPFEIQGRMAEAVELCETAIEVARLSANPHYLFWALFESAWALYYSGDLDGAIAAGEESARVGERMVGGTMPSSGGGPGWVLGVARFEAGEHERGYEIMRASCGDDLRGKIPVERCFDWEIFVLAELELGTKELADEYAKRSEENAARLGLKLPEAISTRTRAAVLLAVDEPAAAAAKAEQSVTAATAIGARLQAGFSRTLMGRALLTAGDRPGAIEALRAAEADLDACGCVRERDAVRRDLRKLGARAEPRGPATPEDSGLASLTKRELEIANLVTDRKTNREIAAELFLSGKTIESHLRNIFVKLGASSRVEVARTVEGARREQDGAESR
ncbi:MAG TPA: AAA family ATPase [Thermoleophilaceae bacterium]|nr:AAA family ATPase [Thermoleophilaceae bacterium]